MESFRAFVRNRPWLAAWLVAALLARALVPVGFMPGAGGIVLCPGYAAAAPADHAGPGDGHAQVDDHACRYAAAVVPMGTPQPAPAVAYAPVVSFEAQPPAERPVVHATIAPTRLPRGPPA